MNLFGRGRGAQALIRRAEELLADGDSEAALDELDAAVVRFPDSEQVWFSRGAALAHLGAYADALPDYDETLRLKTDFAQAFYNRGLARLHLGDYDGAIADMNAALDSGLREKYLVFGTRGSAHFALGDIESAHEDYMRAETVLVGWVYARAGLAICHHALGEGDPARELWSGLLAKDERYIDLDWIQQQFAWPEPLMAAVEKLLATLD